MPNMRLYRAAWLVAGLFSLLALFTLWAPNPPPLSTQPTAFNGERAFADVQQLAQDFPRRVAGSDNGNRCAVWLVQKLKEIGLEAHLDSFTAVIESRDVALQNVWAVSPGDADRPILIVANRDSPPGTSQGADNNASGIAVALELARDFGVASHTHPVLFLWTDGDAFGALGARDFVERHPEVNEALAVIALRQVGRKDPAAITLDGWGATPRVAPPWLWVVASNAGRTDARLRTPLPNILTQLFRLALPLSAGSQGPFVAEGVPGVSVSAEAKDVPPAADTMTVVSVASLARVGRAAERVVTTVDGSPEPGGRSSGTLFFSRYRALNGTVVSLVLAALFIPAALVTLDLFAQRRRRRARLWPAWAQYGLRYLPWLFILAVIYLANLLSLLPRSQGAIIPPEAAVSENPRYLRIALLAALFLLAYRYTLRLGHRLAKQHPVAREDLWFVAFAGLVLIAILVVLVNPFSLVLLLPAGALWPLARAGSWHRSLLPVWAGLASLAAALVFYAARLELGADVWWYFFLLLENRSIPPDAAVLGLAFVATAVMLSATLHERRTREPAEVSDKSKNPPASPDDAQGKGRTLRRFRYPRTPRHRRDRPVPGDR